MDVDSLNLILIERGQNRANLVEIESAGKQCKFSGSELEKLSNKCR